MPFLDDRRVSAGQFELRCRVGGNEEGNPLLLLHGYPQTHSCWHRIAPELAQTHRLIVPDLPGYGDSSFVEPDDGNVVYSKRSMAETLIAMMNELGIGTFGVVAHDRGARVAYRMALDHPDRITTIAVIDIIPTIDEWALFDKDESIANFHWPFLAQTGGLAETMISADPEYFVQQLLERWAVNADSLNSHAIEEYVRCFSREEVIRATCADYRAGATIDAIHDEESLRAGRSIACPLLVVASAGRGDLIDAWSQWADNATGAVLAGGHFLAEEAPADLLACLRTFQQ